MKETPWEERSRQRDRERAIDALRRGEPILLVSSEEGAWLIQAESFWNPQLAGESDPLFPSDSQRIRMHRSQESQGKEAIFTTKKTGGGEENLSGRERDFAGWAVTLLRQAGLPMQFRRWVCHEEDVSRLRSRDVLSVALPLPTEPPPAKIHQITEANLPLDGFIEPACLALFRRGCHGPDHAALRIGDPSPSEPVLVRIHSCCFTGDIFGSLRCDCGEQLAGALERLKEVQSGVILYMNQEGRGIGLVDKLRAYTLQDQGLDTVQANYALGYRADEREFQDAADILHHLGLVRVRLMTNNPYKVASLRKHNIEIVAREKLPIFANPHNRHYLSVKQRVLGHYPGD